MGLSSHLVSSIGITSALDFWIDKMEPIAGLNLMDCASTLEEPQRRTGSDCLDTVLQLRTSFSWHKPRRLTNKIVLYNS